MSQVLFICNGNVARSQEAALYFNQLKKYDSDGATSAGVNVTVGKPIDPLVVSTMAEDGYNTVGCYRKQLTEQDVSSADIIVSFKPAEELPSYARTAGQIRFWEVPDPRQQDLEFFRNVRDDVKRRVVELLEELESNEK